MISDNLKGHLAAITTNVIFGLNISLTKALIVQSWIAPLGWTMTRMLFGFVMFWAFSFIVPSEKINFRDLLTLFACGILGLVVPQLSFFFGLLYISPVLSSLIPALNPIFVLLLSAVFLSDPVSLRKTIGVIIGMSGAALAVLQYGNGSTSINYFWGIGGLLLSVISNSSYLIIMRKIAVKYMPITIMKWMFLGAVIVLSPFGIPDLPGQRLYTPEVTLLPIVMVVFSLFLSVLLALIMMPVALRRIKATTVSMYANLQPLAASTAAIIVGQDVLSWDKPLALILIVLGVFIVTRSQSPVNKEKKKT